MLSLDIVGHTEASKRAHPVGNGEMTNCQVFCDHLKESPYPMGKLWDAYELLDLEDLGDRFHLFLKEPDQITKRISEYFWKQFTPSSVCLLLTHHGILACLHELGAYRAAPTISRLYALDDFSSVCPHFHEPCTLTLTQSPLASELAVEQGLDPSRILYLPFQRLPRPTKDAVFRRTYLKRLGIDPDSVVVGCAVRMRSGKNVEYLLDALQAIHSEVPEAALVIKGCLDDEWDRSLSEGYTERLRAQLEAFRRYPWFAWDERVTPHDEQLKILQAFDVAAYPSGCDDPANVICEQLACGTPTLVLDGGPRPSLFGGLAHFTPHQGYANMGRCVMPFFKPDPDALADNLLQLIRERKGCDPELAQRRFGAAVTQEKLPLAIEGAYHLFHKTDREDEFRQRIRDEWIKDCKRFATDSH